MPKIPDDFRDDIRQGFIPSVDVMEWLEDQPASIRDSIYAGMDAGLSLDWAMLLTDQDVSLNPHDWDSLRITVHDRDNLDVHITDRQGNTHDFEDITQRALVWSDIWYTISEGYPDVDVEKEYKGEGAT